MHIHPGKGDTVPTLTTRRRKKIGEILLSQGLITHEQLIRGLEEHRRTGVSLGTILVKQGFISEDELSSVLGQQIQIDTGEHRLEAVVTEVGAIDRHGSYEAVLKVVPDAGPPAEVFSPPTAGHDANPAEEAAADDFAADDPIDAEDWTPHPFRDAWEAIRRYGGPVALVSARIAVVAGRALVRGASWLWARIPEKARAKVGAVKAPR